MKKTYLLAAWLLVGPVAGAWANGDWRSWASANFQTRIGDSRYLAFLELAPRFVDDSSRLGQFIIRPLLGYELTKNLQFWLGYAWQGEYDPAGAVQFDNATQDIVQQAQWVGDLAPRLNFQYRLRLEQRLFADADIGHRLRHRLRLQYALPDSHLYLVTSQEVFLHLNALDHSPRAHTVQPGFNQLRSYFGVGYTLRPGLNVDTGYQLQYINLFGAQDQAHPVWLTHLTVMF